MSAATTPRPFATEDYGRRMARAAGTATDAGLTGLLATPGADLLYLTGYSPMALTERITMLVVQGGGEPALIVPDLERPDAEGALGPAGIAIAGWADGDDPYAAAALLLEPRGRYAVSDATWA